MNRRLSRELRVPLFLLMVLALVSMVGCGGGGGTPPPPGPVKNYGPPLYDVLFLDGSDYIATVDPDGGTTVTYVEHVGGSADLSTPGLGVLYKMTTPTSETTNLLVYDYSTSTLNILDEYGTVLYEYTDILPDFYDATESRVVRIQEKDGGYELQISRWEESVYTTYSMGSVEAPYAYASRPSLNGSANRAVIAIHNTEDSTLDRIAVMGENDYERSTKTISALAPQYSPDNDEYIAYLEAPDGPELVSGLVITDGNLDEELARFTFGQYGTGATSFAWSPNGSRIALYTDIYGPEPQLVVIDIEEMLVIPYDLGEYTITLGSGDELYWAFPEWKNDSTELVIPAKKDVDGTTEYHIIAYNFLENSTRSISDEGAESTHPHWRKYIY